MRGANTRSEKLAGFREGEPSITHFYPKTQPGIQILGFYCLPKPRVRMMVGLAIAEGYRGCWRPSTRSQINATSGGWQDCQQTSSFGISSTVMVMAILPCLE